MNNRSMFISLGAIIAVLLATDVFLVSRNLVLKKESAIKDETIWRLSDGQLLTSYLQSNLSFGLKHNGTAFTACPILDIDGNNVDMKNYGDDPVLVFRFNEHDCVECISFGMNELVSFAGDVSDTVLVLARYGDINAFRRWARTMELPDNVVLCCTSSTVEADGISTPYFFVLHKDMTIGEIFIPDKSFPKQTDTYLQMVSGKFHNS